MQEGLSFTSEIENSIQRIIFNSDNVKSTIDLLHPINTKQSEESEHASKDLLELLEGIKTFLNEIKNISEATRDIGKFTKSMDISFDKFSFN